MADPNTFMQVPGIPGGSRAAGHEGWIELLSVDVKQVRAPSKDKGIPAEFDVNVGKKPDKASQNLLSAYRSGKSFETIVIETVSSSGTTKHTFKNVHISSFSTSTGEPPTETITFTCSEHETDHKPSAPEGSREPGSGFDLKENIPNEVQPKKKPGVTRAVVRANASAVTERSTLNLRPGRFFELALPVLNGDNGQRVYPPAAATLRLASAKGYNRTQPVTAGMVTDDQFCSFRFYDITEKQAEELFTATLEWDKNKEIIFQDRRVATYIQSARNTGQYEAAFSHAEDSSVPEHNDMLAPVNGTSNET